MTTQMPMLFETTPTAHACGPLSFSPYTPDLSVIARPTYLSAIPPGTDVSTALKGAELLGLPLLPQGMHIAGVLEAVHADGTPLYPTVGIRIPRRATKTTSIWDVLLGRCWARPGTKVITTAQDGLRARNRFKDVLRALDARGFESRGLGRLRWGAGSEAIEFANESRIWVVPPEAGAFRGEAADVMLFDEAGELTPDKSEDLEAGALPLLDTRPQGQVIIAGTPGKYRAGLLWATIAAGIRGEAGIVDYSILDDESSVIYPAGPDELPILDEEILCRVHPGIGTVTTLPKMRDRFAKMSLAQFEREYLCRTPFDSASTAISPVAWADGLAGEGLPPRPDRVGLAYDVEPDGSSAALAAAWRDDEGHAHLEILAYRPGTHWLASVAGTAAKRHRAPIAYDTIGANSDPADQLHRLHAQLRPLSLRHVQGAAQRLASEIERRHIVHYGQPDLDRAVAGANWRTVGESGRLFGRKASAHPVAPLVAAAHALWSWDAQPARTSRTIIARTDGRSR